MAGVKGRSGGKRIGAGRPAKSAKEKALGGWAGRRENRETKRQALAQGDAEVEREEVIQPIDLSVEQAAVWQELAPHATSLGTLTPASAHAFRDVCEVICVKRAVLNEILARGWTVGDVISPKAHPLLTRYQGLYQRVEMGLQRFGLAPMGEDMHYGAPPEPEADPFAEFDDGTARH